MRSLLFLILCLFSSLILAQSEVSTQIHDIDMGQGVGEQPLIYLSTGQVVTYPQAEKTIFDRLREAINSKTWFTLVLNDKREIISIKNISSPTSISLFKMKKNYEPFLPSILKNLDYTKSFFYEARKDAKAESQCFNRAHVWAYEWRTKNNLYSSKAWIFFTRRFIRKYKFEWWFHVAPMVHVVHEGKVRERVMDIKYARGPLKLKEWTDIFVRDDADCPVVEKYSEQALHPESVSCFMMKSSMYYYQPVDLEQSEITGDLKHRWQESEVKQAYLEAFGVTLQEKENE